MQLPKPTESDKELFRSVIPDAPTITIKPMFGNLGAFVNGNMFAGLFGSTIGIRVLDEATRAELQEIDAIAPFGPSERPMREYVGLPAAWASEPELLASWVARAFWQVETLPEKKPKPRQQK
ncbi:TfoX/Sxy family protein [Salinibacterium sp. G-O1]|uniref:TfoX/Sxy family protein n=1 Tax=Salinibacterium sp. G-O1 TaxID=3046208 RepID=UPI0024B9BDB3|nr:TfoX/Sxy family protein [Salinibacterium sp. G-O1]MDJ0333941.1 TfoX/Sxy family protein [Salinibacterium sp. G-O1]